MSKKKSSTSPKSVRTIGRRLMKEALKNPHLQSGVAMCAEAAPSPEPSRYELQARAERRLLQAIADCAYDVERLPAQTAALVAVRG